MALDNVLGQLENVRQENGGWRASCPVTGHGKGNGDTNPSLSISEGENGNILLKCRAGCATEEVLQVLGLEMKDLFVGAKRNVGSTPPKSHAPLHHSDQKPVDKAKNGGESDAPPDASPDTTASPGCTLEAYAKAKGLPVEFLERLRLREQKYQGKTAIRIPYLDEAGEEVAVRYRTALEKVEGSDDRFRWKSGSKAMLYGLWRLAQIREAGYVVLVEGESDCHTLWHHGIPALGIPGSGTFKPDWSEYLEGVGKVYAVVEPDQGGEALWERLAASPLRERLYRVELEEAEDVSGLHVGDPERFREKLRSALEGATAWLDLAESEAQERRREAWATCADLAQEPDILERFAHDLRRAGLVGEVRGAKLLYLAVTSRLLDKIVSVAVKGPSSGGKSYMVERVLEFFPESAYYALTAMSEHALAYGDEPLNHRFLVIYEAAGMSSDFQSYLIRSLFSEGRLRYETVEKTADGLKPRVIEREGPTGLIVTTTMTKLHPENETRLLSLTVTDTHDQTRAVMAALANETAGEGPDINVWHAVQKFLEGGDNRVTVPYAGKLAELIPPVAVRLRRDFGAVLNLIRAHALLHQATRERDEEGRIVATIEDYAKVRELVVDLVSEGVGATVSQSVRQVVASLHHLLDWNEGEPMSARAVAGELKLDPSAASRRLKSAMDKGFVKNLEDRRGRPGRYVLGEPLPDDVEVLPAAEVVMHRCSANEGDRTHLSFAVRSAKGSDGPSDGDEWEEVG